MRPVRLYKDNCGMSIDNGNCSNHPATGYLMCREHIRLHVARYYMSLASLRKGA